MNFIVNVGKFLVFSVAGMAVRNTWSWLTADIEPSPGTKEFDIELEKTKRRYLYLKQRKEEYDETIRKVQ
jgi:nitric oxide synthase oxygenase domain/subunit|tara:strand:+ start:823 stop:1032 length:210 start_codon:yes stop_codon:yes gene_type:complete